MKHYAIYCENWRMEERLAMLDEAKLKYSFPIASILQIEQHVNIEQDIFIHYIANPKLLARIDLCPHLLSLKEHLVSDTSDGLL